MFVIAAILFVQAIPQQPADSIAADSTRRRAQELEGVQVTAIRGGAAPISAKTLQRSEIQRRYTGQETPILLQAAPGITAYSESGSASNYSYIRLRGIDQSRINITLDGIPLNEPEDEALYFSNFPDFSNSIASVQVQRGVGSSTHGTASYAGSVNFESIPIAGVQRGGELQLTGGSYGTVRGSAVYQTGLMENGFAGYLRASSQRTDGYRFNSGNRSRSAFASGGWFGTSDIIKVSLLAGLSSNEQAYYASALSVLRTTPRDNPFGNSPESAVNDRFHQDLLSVAWTHVLSPSVTANTTGYGFDAGGWYDYPGDAGLADAYHYGLHSRWGGVISALDWQGESATASFGLNAARYQREHWLTQRPGMADRYYDNTGHKGEQSVFAKGSLTRGRFTYSADVQGRFVQFRYEPTPGSKLSAPSVRWAFLNPKFGVSAAVSEGLSAYASVGRNGREPARGDMFAGADDVDSTNAPVVFPLTRVRPETANDLEAGVNWHRSSVRLQANLFLMRFVNEIAAIGEVSELGFDLRKNVDRSNRRGFETDVSWQATPAVMLTSTVAITDARIREYHDDASRTTYHDVTPLLTPKLVSNQGLRAKVAPWLTLDVDGRYVSRMMLTNTNDPRFTVPASWYSDVGATFRVGKQSVLVQLRNVFDRTVYTGGYPDAAVNSSDPNAQEPYYFPLAPRNISVNARIAF